MRKNRFVKNLPDNSIFDLINFFSNILCILNSIVLIYIGYLMYNINKMILLSKKIRTTHNEKMMTSDIGFILSENYKRNFNIAVIGYNKGKYSFMKFITNNNDLLNANTKNNNPTPYSINRINLTDVLVWDLSVNKFGNKNYYEKMNLGKFNMIVIFPIWEETSYISIVYELQKNKIPHHIIFDVSNEIESAIDTNSKKAVVTDITNYIKKSSIDKFHIIHNNNTQEQKKIYGDILKEIISSKVKNIKTTNQSKDQSNCVIS